MPQLGVSPTHPDPDREAVVWLEGVYTAVDGEPVRMAEQPDLQRLIARAVEQDRSGSFTVAQLLEVLADATGLRPAEIIRRTALARASLADEQRAHRLDLDLGLSHQWWVREHLIPRLAPSRAVRRARLRRHPSPPLTPAHPKA